MRFRFAPLSAACCLLSLLPAGADVLTMKNGEKIEGTILREEGANYVVEVNVTSRIRDEKIIPRADVLKIEKTPEHEKAFAAIADLAPAPELLEADAYVERINKLREYVTAFPKAPKTPHVEGMIKALEEEMELIKGGAIKFGEGIIPAEQYQANAFEIDARIAEKKIREAIARRDYLGALRGFDTYETTFGSTDGHANLAPLIMQVLGAYNESISESLASFDTRMAARKAGLARMAPGDRAKSERALESEQKDLAERLQKEKDAKIKWVTPSAFLKESLDEAQKQAVAELSRLEKLEKENDTPLAELYRKVWHLLESAADDEERNTILEEAKEKNLPATYLDKLRDRAEFLKKKQEEEAEKEAEEAEKAESEKIDPFADQPESEKPKAGDDK